LTFHQLEYFPMIHPAAIIEDGVQLGADCEIHAQAVIKRGAVLGDRVVVHPFAVIGGDPQDLKFDRATPSGVRIGSSTTIREYVTVNRSTRSGGLTEIGEDCFLMAGSHVAHDCVVGRSVVMANATLLGGHVRVGDHAFLGGGAVFHQFIRIGESVMVSGNSRISLELPPFVLVAERNRVAGLNLVGLRRRGFPREAIQELKDAFRRVYFTSGNIRETAADLLGEGKYQTGETRSFLEFFTAGKRGFARPRRGAVADGE
jgi:UDP-N-acetylglucosamine acyltransferase